MPSRKQLQLYDDHYDMLADTVRMDAYGRAIQQVVRPGDRVVDLGAGLGILGMLALRAGAAHVYAIEKSDCVDLAREIAARNGLADRMTFFHASSKDVQLEQPADVLLSETLGSFGVEENTLDFTLDARRRLLKPGGRMLPRALRLWVAPVQNAGSWERVGFWNQVHGLSFEPAVDEILGRMSPADIAQADLLSSPQLFHQVDLRRHEHVDVANTLLFPIERPGTVHGVAGWFQVELCDGVVISTGPDAPSTHWRQAFFPVRQPPTVIAGDYFELTLGVGPSGPRSDDTRVQLDFRCTQLGG
jgi:protein arginine N-methyltransferase 1